MQAANIFRIVSLAIGIIVILALILTYNFSGAIQAFSHLKPIYVLLAIAAFIAYVVLRYLPWAYLIRQTELKAGLLHSFLAMQAFFDLGMIPVVFQVISLEYLERLKKNIKLFSGSILLSTNLAGFFALICVAVVVSLFISVYIPYLIALLAVVYLIMSLLGKPSWTKYAINFLRRVNLRLKSNIIRTGLKYFHTLKKTRAFLSQKDILFETLAFVPSLIAENLLVYFILVAFNQNVSFLYVLFFFCLADIIGQISLIPLAAGALDISFIGFMAALGVPGAIALSTIIIYRLFMNMILPIFGYACLAGLGFLTRIELVIPRRIQQMAFRSPFSKSDSKSKKNTKRTAK